MRTNLINVSGDLSADYPASQALEDVNKRRAELSATMQALSAVDPRTRDADHVRKANEAKSEHDALRVEHSKLRQLLELEASARHYKETGVHHG
jgi:hypothetical protein